MFDSTALITGLADPCFPRMTYDEFVAVLRRLDDEFGEEFKVSHRLAPFEDVQASLVDPRVITVKVRGAPGGLPLGFVQTFCATSGLYASSSDQSSVGVVNAWGYVGLKHSVNLLDVLLAHTLIELKRRGIRYVFSGGVSSRAQFAFVRQGFLGNNPARETTQCFREVGPCPAWEDEIPYVAAEHAYAAHGLVHSKVWRLREY